jgi:hypothetical protein
MLKIRKMGWQRARTKLRQSVFDHLTILNTSR